MSKVSKTRPALYRGSFTLYRNTAHSETWFYRWLMRHLDQHNAIGDLARDAFDDARGYGIRKRGHNWDGTLKMLRVLVAKEGNARVKETLADARQRYREFKKAKRGDVA